LSRSNDDDATLAGAHARLTLLTDPARLTTVRARRRLAVRLGSLALLAACVTACIFDKGDYQGGGRLDKGATSTKASGTASDAASPADPTDAAATD
jgi:hypothetical protein